MRKRYLIILVVALMALLAISPLRAQTDTDIPTITQPEKGRFELLMMGDNQPLMVGAGKFSSLQQLYMTLILFPQPDFPTGMIAEFVQFESTAYIRVNDDQQWYFSIDDTATAPVTTPDVVPTLPEGVEVDLIGTETVSGATTSHYQVTLTELEGFSGKIDMWVGQQNNYLYQARLEFSVDDVGAPADSSTPDNVMFLMRFFDLNDPAIIVGTPADAIAGMPDIGAFGTLNNSRVSPFNLPGSPLDNPFPVR